MAQPVKRRIQPQLISTSQPAGPGPSFEAPSAPSMQPVVPSVHVQSITPTWSPPGVKEDSDRAAEVGQKGRRVFVELDEPCKHISWTKLLASRGWTASELRPQKPVEPAAPAMPGFPDFDSSKQGAANNPLARLIARIERQYLVNNGEDSSDGDEQRLPKRGYRSNGQSEDESGADAEFSDGEYDYEDDFIDDSEFADFVKGDRRKPKHSGFFINKGEIEKTDQEIPLDSDSPPPKKRKKKAKAPQEILNSEIEEPQEKGAAEPPKKKKRRKETSPFGEAAKPAKKIKPKRIVPTALASAAAAEPTGVSTQPAVHPSLAEQAAAAGMLASAANGDAQPTAAARSKADAAHSASCETMQQGSQAYTPSKQMSQALALLKEAANTAKEEDAQNPSKGIPKELNSMLSSFACLMARECEQRPSARDIVLDQVTAVFDPLYGRAKFVQRLDALAKGAKEDLAATFAKIRERVDGKIRNLEERASREFGPSLESISKPEAFPWDKILEHYVLTYTNLHNKVNCQMVEGDEADASKPLSELLQLWPPGRMTLELLHSALKKARQNPKATGGARAQRKSMDSADALALNPNESREGSADDEPQSRTAALPCIPEEPSTSQSAAALPPSVALPLEQPGISAPVTSAHPAKVTGLEAPPAAASKPANFPSQPPETGARPASAVSSQPQLSANTDTAARAISLGADGRIIADSIQALATGQKLIINKVLMCAGTAGYTTQDIVDKANELGLTGSAPWDKTKKPAITTCIRNSKFHAAIGHLRYAHMAFPGVSELALKEQVAADAKKRARDELAKCRSEPATKPIANGVGRPRTDDEQSANPETAAENLSASGELPTAPALNLPQALSSQLQAT